MSKILVVGDIFLDILPSAFPVEKEKVLHDGESFVDNIVFQRGGCAGNFVAVMKSVFKEFDIDFISKIGSDMNGKFLVEEMNRYGVNPKFIVSEGENSAITLAISFKDGERHFITQLGAMDSFSLKDIDTSIFKNYTHLAYRGIWFAKHLLENADQLMRMAKESGLSTSMDLGFDPLWALNHPDVPKRKSAALAALPYVDYLFGNQNELKNLTDTQTLEEAILKIQDHGVGTIVIHMGSKGARIVRKEEVIDIPVFKIEIINPVGSGDTFDSIFIGSVIEGKPLKESGNNASAGAAYSISHPAGTILDRSLIEQFRQNKG